MGELMPYDPKEQHSERRARHRQEDREDAQHIQNLAWLTGPGWAVWLVVIVAIVSLGLFGVRSWLLPAEEALRRDVYEESKSYRDGTVRDLDNLRLQWLSADDDVHKRALGNTAVHRATDFPREELPERIREWLAELGG